MYFGSQVEADMNAAAEKGKTTKAARQKAQMALNKWLIEPGERPAFRDPAAQR